MARQDIYKSQEWKNLNPLDRASILLVSEGVKPGTTIGSRNRPELENVLKRLGLHHLPPKKSKKNYTYTIAKDDKTLSDLIRNDIDLRVNGRQMTKIRGRFYGFPECCIDNFAGSKIYLDKDISKMPVWISFRDILKQYKAKNGSYPEQHDYRVPGMVPCDVECKNALSLLNEFKKALNKYDEAAAETLKTFNKQGYITTRIY
jgi:hypothetical protein